ncbi:hypothetical protein D3C81_375850 [compost metagenome]
MKLFSHMVTIPPLTDVQEMLGSYKALFITIGIGKAEEMAFPVAGGFTHPIPEENQRLTNDFFNTSRVLQQLVRDKVNVHLSGTRVQGVTVTFMFGYNEATDHDQAPAPS